jgi:hypothetical protein
MQWTGEDNVERDYNLTTKSQEGSLATACNTAYVSLIKTQARAVVTHMATRIVHRHFGKLQQEADALLVCLAPTLRILVLYFSIHPLPSVL